MDVRSCSNTMMFILHNTVCYYRALVMIGLLIIAIGTGGIKPCVAAFGGDQFKETQVSQFKLSEHVVMDSIAFAHMHILPKNLCDFKNVVTQRKFTFVVLHFVDGYAKTLFFTVLLFHQCW